MPKDNTETLDERGLHPNATFSTTSLLNGIGNRDQLDSHFRRIKMGGRDPRGDIYVCFRKEKLIGARTSSGEIDLNSKLVGIQGREKPL